MDRGVADSNLGHSNRNGINSTHFSSFVYVWVWYYRRYFCPQIVFCLFVVLFSSRSKASIPSFRFGGFDRGRFMSTVRVF